MAKLTDSQLRALRALEADHLSGSRGHTGRSLAQVLYPDSDAWAKTTRSRPGFQGSKGGTMPMLGAKVARGLADKNLVRVEYTDYHQAVFYITDAGRRALAAAAA